MSLVLRELILLDFVKKILMLFIFNDLKVKIIQRNYMNIKSISLENNRSIKFCLKDDVLIFSNFDEAINLLGYNFK